MSDNLFPTDNEAVRLIAENVMANMRFCLPGIIESFDKDTNLAEVTPAIKRKDVIGKTVEYSQLPIIIRVPIVLPGVIGQGLFVTVPIKKGDEGVLLFSDRFLDDFIERGGIAYPESRGPNNLYTMPRIHNLTDAMFMPCGFLSQPNRIPEWNEDNIEIRDKERNVFISLGAEGIEGTDGIARVRITEGMVEATDSEATWEMKDGHLSINAPNGIDIEAPNFRIKSSDGYGWTSGTFQAEELETDAGFAANSHRHSGVEPGSGNTGTFV